VAVLFVTSAHPLNDLLVTTLEPE